MRKLNTCPEVCLECRSGEHIFHILTELSDLWAYRVKQNGRLKFKIEGYADPGKNNQDNFWLELLLQSRMFNEQE